MQSPALAPSLPEPLPSAAALPDEPPLRSELIDLTRAVQRCRTWQQLRRLYWRVRTRQGPMNMVGFFTRLAALVGPGLPQLLGEEGEEEAIMVTAEGPGQELRVPGQEAEDGAAAGREAGAGKAQRSRSRGPEGSPRGQQGPPVPSGPLQSHAERAALRQLVVRMMYDACSFTREHAAADLLDVMRRNPLPPWNMPAFAAYTQQQVAALQAAHQRGGAGLGTRAGAGVGVGAGGGAAAGRQVSFLEWLREHPEMWEHPYEAILDEHVHHWRASPGAGAGTTGADGADSAYGSGRSRSSSGRSGAGGTRSRQAPVCYGPHELSALVWAAARLRLPGAVAAEHLTWLLDDLLSASFGVMPDFDGRQLSQLAYSLSQLGPLAVPPPPWRRAFLAASRRRLFQMDAQSLANLSHALEPLRLSPDPPWLRDLLAATGAAMSITGPGQGLRGQGQGHGGQGQEQGQQRWGPAQRPGTLRPAPPELTQLAWALFSLRRRCATRAATAAISDRGRSRPGSLEAVLRSWRKHYQCFHHQQRKHGVAAGDGGGVPQAMAAAAPATATTTTLGECPCCP
eukprot:XP_001694541.1 chloroplast tscA maturation factor [Chlamydomonas reinhardtii]